MGVQEAKSRENHLGTFLRDADAGNTLSHVFPPGCAVTFWSSVTMSHLKALAKIKPK